VNAVDCGGRNACNRPMWFENLEVLVKQNQRPFGRTCPRPVLIVLSSHRTKDLDLVR